MKWLFKKSSMCFLKRLLGALNKIQPKGALVHVLGWSIEYKS